MKKGDTVHWHWGQNEAEGEIIKKHTKPVEKTIKGTSVKRKADTDKPAYEIKQENGSKVLKLATELKMGGK